MVYGRSHWKGKTKMTEDMKMYVAMGIFVILPIGIMVMAWLADLFDRWLLTARLSDRLDR